MGLYPKKPYEIGFGQAALYPGRTMDHVVVAKVDLPCTTIVIHGVNDLGVSYGAVESGLCTGMSRRLKLPDGAFRPNSYRDFTDADRDKLEPDPDAIFFKRMPTADAHSYIVPFYWGFREEQDSVQPGSQAASSHTARTSTAMATASTRTPARRAALSRTRRTPCPICGTEASAVLTASSTR